MRIDLNADLGEGCGNDEALLKLVSSASIACESFSRGALRTSASARSGRPSARSQSAMIAT